MPKKKAGKIACCVLGDRGEEVMMAQKVRRVVTGHNDYGKSIVIIDSDAPNVRVLKHRGGTTETNLWMTSSVPADNSIIEDLGVDELKIEPPPGGTIFRILEYPPDEVRFAARDQDTAFRELGVHGAMVKEEARHPGMHKTNTLDYVIVLSGEIYAVLDEGEVRLKAGDCFIQRGTNHAWSNRTKESCRVAFVLVGANPI